VSIITLSRGSKSGGLALVEMLGKELDCHNIISRKVLVKVSEDYGVTEKELSQALDRPPKLWERSAGNPRHLYLTFVRAAILDYAVKGCTIYHGNAGHFLLGDVSWVLKVRLIAPMDMRVAMLQKTMDIDWSEAVQYITKIDEDRMKWTRFLYGEDWADPTHFDLVINLKTMTLETACEVIADLTRSPEFTRSPERQKDLQNKALAAKVQAAIDTSPKIRCMDVTIVADEDVVTLSGRIASSSIRKEMVAIAQNVPGVKDVRDSMTTF
jgi:cytidylate kinase